MRGSRVFAAQKLHKSEVMTLLYLKTLEQSYQLQRILAVDGEGSQVLLLWGSR